MKLGYPCINWSVKCRASQTFRLASYSDKRLVETVESNLNCLRNILEWNFKHNLLFFRISSDIIPFASHPINQFNWTAHFAHQLQSIGKYIIDHDIRISMHPDQFVLINSPKQEIVQKSIADLDWHCRLLDALGLDQTAKVQIHVGGVYGDKDSAIKRFIKNYQNLPTHIRKRLVIENDDRLFSLADCLSLHQQCGAPILFDVFHHHCLNHGESVQNALLLANQTWGESDGLLMVDYSSQQAKARKGKHADTIDLADFKQFLLKAQSTNFDIMLEIKDKEKSALKALELSRQSF